MLADLKLPKVSVIFVNCQSMFLSEERSQALQFLAARYPTDLENSLMAGPEEMVNIDVFADNLGCEADLDLLSLAAGPDFGSTSSTPAD